MLPPALRQALRRIAKAPLLSGLVVVTLGPGIGAHVAIFRLVDVLFLQPLPVKDAGRLAGIYQTRDERGFFPLSLPDYLDYRSSTTLFSDVASHYPTSPLVLSRGGATIELNGSVVSANYFSLLGVKPERGRFFLTGEDHASAGSPVVVVSHRFWQAHLDGRPDVVGQLLRLNNTAFTVVGVAPERFTGVLFGIPSDVWITNAMSAVGYRWCDTRDRDCTWITMIGRLKPGRTLADAQAEAAGLAHAMREAHPRAAEGHGLRVSPLRGVHPAARPDTLRLAVLLVAGVSLGVAVACANLACVLMARGLARRTEIAVRLALGASRLQVIVQVTIEAVLLALLGGVAGVLIAPVIGRLVVTLYPSDVPLDLPMDLRTVAYAIVFSLLVGLFVGLLPAVQSTRPDLAPALKDAPPGTGGQRRRLLGALIVVQVALSFVLLTSTGLLARSLASAGRGIGLDASRVVALRMRPLLVDYQPAQGQAFSREALRRVAAMPGVQAVSLGVVLQPWMQGDPLPVARSGQRATRTRDAATAWVGRIGPRFFRTFAVPILLGRDLEDRDVAGAPLVAVVNQAIARRLWPSTSPIGRRLVIQDHDYEVVGLVPDLGFHTALEPPAPQVYLSYWQDDRLVDARLCVRVAGDPLTMAHALRRELHAIDPNVPVTEVEPVTESLERFLAPVRVAGRILGLSALLALLLSAIGLFGALSLAIAQRSHEIGIRIAVGADRRQVMTWMVRGAAAPLATALVLGWFSALGAGRLLAHYLYGVDVFDPLTFALALATLGATAAAAALVPAWRASRIDPLTALQRR